MTHSNAERFLQAFTTIEDALSKQQGRNAYSPEFRDFCGFTDLVRESKNAMIRQDRDLLLGLAPLRNAIVHNGKVNGRIISDPRDDVVETIERIAHLLVRPPQVSDVMGKPGVKVLDENASVRDFLELVTKQSYSQAPVKTRNGLALVTTNAVSRWFAAVWKEAGDAVDSTNLRTVLDFAETGDRLVSLPPTSTVVQAINVFTGEDDPNREPPAALLLTGGMHQPHLALCSRADLPRLYAALT